MMMSLKLAKMTNENKSNDMIIKNGFYIVPELEEIITESLKGVIQSRVNHRLKLEFSEDSDFSDIDHLITEIIEMSDDESFEFFKLESKTEKEIEVLSRIRFYFVLFLKKSSNRFLKVQSSGSKKEICELWSVTCRMMLIFKNMVGNEHYGLIKFCKIFILKNIEFLNQVGMAMSFLVLCELCPAFVCNYCYPVVNTSSEIYFLSMDLAEKNPFFNDLIIKHNDRWSQFYEVI
jgi:hypothetical protein